MLRGWGRCVERLVDVLRGWGRCIYWMYLRMFKGVLLGCVDAVSCLPDEDGVFVVGHHVEHTRHGGGVALELVDEIQRVSVDREVDKVC